MLSWYATVCWYMYHASYLGGRGWTAGWAQNFVKWPQCKKSKSVEGVGNFGLTPYLPNFRTFFLLCNPVCNVFYAVCRGRPSISMRVHAPEGSPALPEDLPPGALADLRRPPRPPPEGAVARREERPRRSHCRRRAGDDIVQGVERALPVSDQVFELAERAGY